jgi:branched-chain amino acid transport system substrate-binding protein
MNRILLYAFALMLLFVSGCNNDDTDLPGEITTYPIAGLFSLTGNWSSLGVTSKEVLSIAVKDVNTYVDS